MNTHLTLFGDRSRFRILIDFMEGPMKTRVLYLLLTCLVISCVASAQVTINGDTSYISGATFAGAGFLGEMDSTISSDTTSTGARKNPNAVYALYEGQVYYQLTPIYYNNPTGVLTIVGVPDPKNPSAKTKPIILIQPTDGEVPSNLVYGSIKIVNVHWQVMETNGNLQSELFYCGTRNQHPQELILDNDMFEFSNTDIFDCTNETGAIGGWPYGAKFFITNCYFRNMFEPGQWWGSRVFQCKHPIDTLWVENCTVTTGGLTFLQQNELTDFAYFNHNTIINNKKYWLLSPYHRNFFVTNNIFVNQNWVGEDTNVAEENDAYNGQWKSTIIIDSINDGEYAQVQPKYEGSPGDSTGYSPLLALNKMQVYISNNINFDDPLITSGYYTNSAYVLSDTGSPPKAWGPGLPSYLDWFYPGVHKVENIPGEWENTNTRAILAAHTPAMGGGMIEEYTITPSLSPISYGMTAAVVTAMAQWNQNQYLDPRFSSPTPTLTTTAYIYGDYNPQTLPGIVGGVKTDGITNTTTIGPSDQIGITKFTDLTENFSQSSVTSTIDGFPVGSLIWNDAQNATYAAAHASELARIFSSYTMGIGIVAVKPNPIVATVLNLAQNYPDPFNPSTTIQFTIPSNGRAVLKVFNVLGQEVATLFDGETTAGTNHQAQFNGSNLASGIYFSRLEFGGKMQVKKMLLLK
jgi:hypothetical protein